MSKKTTLLTVVVAAVLLLAVAAIALNAPNRKASDQSASETTKTDEQPTSNKTESSPNDNPTHTKDSELNVGNVPQGSSKTFTVTKKGTWSYHNHNNASDTGTIIVE